MAEKRSEEFRSKNSIITVWLINEEAKKFKELAALNEFTQAGLARFLLRSAIQGKIIIKHECSISTVPD